MGRRIGPMASRVKQVNEEAKKGEQAREERTELNVKQHHLQKNKEYGE